MIALSRILVVSLFLFGSQATLPMLAFAQATEEAETASAELSKDGKAIQTELAARINETKSRAHKARLEAIDAYYAENDYAAVWLENGIPSDKARTVVDALRRASEHGLNPLDYGAEALFQKSRVVVPETLGSFEVHLSTAFVNYAQDLNAGRLDPKSVTRENVIYPDAISEAKILSQGKKTRFITAYLRLLAPHTPRYERLKAALGNYRKMAAAGGWEAIEEGEVLKPDMDDPRVPALRRRLAVSGDYVGPTDLVSTKYQGPVVKAVEYFQKRHGLEIDGVVGGNTLKQLNVPIEDRIATMEYNLERRRWMQDDYGRYYIFANLADQVVKLVRDEKTLHAELIQVGLPYHRTPVFTDEMEYIEINPYWNVPKSIAVNELLPKLRQNPGSLAADNFEVLIGNRAVSPVNVSWSAYSKSHFPVRLRQRPGGKNALGRIKFMFPNRFNIYIHDTPSKQKFDAASRFFSHGCLRLRDPFKLAEVILREQGWDREKIDATVASGKRTVVNLETKIPVHIAYMTAWVNKDGSVHFRRDVYGRDATLGRALAKASG